MSDPISGDAIRQVAKVGGEIPQAEDQAKLAQQAQKFEAALNERAEADQKVKEVLETDIQTRVDKMPHTDKVRMERELETRVMKMDRADQQNFFAQPIQESEKAYFKLRENAETVPDGPNKTKLMETLDKYGGEFKEMDTFLQEFAGGKEFSQKELLAVQLRSHEIVQSMELLTKTVEQSVSGMKTIFQTNV